MLNNERVHKLVKILSKYEIDGYLMGANFDLKFLTGINPFQDKRFKGFLVLKDGRKVFISPELYYEEFRNILGKDMDIYVWGDNQGVNSTFEKLKETYNLEGKTIAIDDSIRGIDLLDMMDIIKADFINEINISKELRIIKDEQGVQALEKAALIADKTYEEVLNFIKPGLREKDISDKIKELLIEFGGESLSFEPIVASGPNSSMPHYNGNNRVIEDQDLVILDFGCVYDGYCSDTSRTVFIGQPTEEQLKVYEIILRANKEAEDAAKEGIKAEDLDRIARGVIEDAGYGKYFINRTGHGIGVEIHEEPYIKEGNKEILKTGMAFSIEPGIYIPGKFGMRVEDIVVIDGNGSKILNKSNKELTII